MSFKKNPSILFLISKNCFIITLLKVSVFSLLTFYCVACIISIYFMFLFYLFDFVTVFYCEEFSKMFDIHFCLFIFNNEVIIS